MQLTWFADVFFIYMYTKTIVTIVAIINTSIPPAIPSVQIKSEIEG